MASKFKVKIKGAKRLELAFDPKRMDARMRKRIRIASGQNGLLAVAVIRDLITSGEFTPNADLTAALKGENKPLVGGTNSLFQAITFKIEDQGLTTFVGVLRTNGLFNIAATIHDGLEIPVSEGMRKLFFVLWLASTGKLKGTLDGRAAELFEQFQDWRPLKAGTKVIVIPERPFIDDAIRSTKVRKGVRQNWKRALEGAMKDAAAGN